MAKPAKRKLPAMPMKVPMKGKMPNKVETKWGSMTKKC